MAGVPLLKWLLLDGVLGDMSEPSSRFDRDMFLFFILLKLDEEKFFRSLLADGEPERLMELSSPSAWPRLLGGDPMNIGSFGGDSLRLVAANRAASPAGTSISRAAADVDLDCDSDASS